MILISEIIGILDQKQLLGNLVILKYGMNIILEMVVFI